MSGPAQDRRHSRLTLDERDGGFSSGPRVVEGDPVTAQPEALQAALDGSLRAWLEGLKRTAEGGPARRAGV
jgi:hypothetical protein